jgi:syntaxin 18
LGRWAAGGLGQSRSPEEEIDAARASTIKMHRENVIWYLTRKLEECGEAQRSMMETRLYREIERSKSVLYKTRAARRISAVLADMDGDMPGIDGGGGARHLTGSRAANRAAQMDEAERKRIEAQLSPDQLQVFAKENQDMLKHYEDTLDQVRYVNSDVPYPLHNIQLIKLIYLGPRSVPC